ncbi:hypothetical protein [Shimia sp. MIT1388]|uniref:hypothetical protein n=1 Tax=Shimia sp. MIT1388 TaxID=3096992 RepID=UPI00399BD0D5
MAEAKAHDCDRFKPLAELNAEMGTAAEARYSASSSTMQRVELHLQGISLKAIERKLTRLNLMSYYPNVEHLLLQASAYVQSGEVSARSEVEDTVRNIDRMIAKICAGQLSGVTGPDGRYEGEAEGDGGFWEDQNDWVRATGFTASAGAVLLFIVGLLTVVRYVIGLIQHKKMCSVPAVLIGNGQDFPGKLSRAGLHAVRFEPLNEAVADQLTELMACPAFIHFDLRVDDVDRPVFVDGYHTFYAPLYFFSNLSRKELWALLSLSERPIRNAPYIGHRSTRKKWRAQIKDRKRLIKQANPAN